MLQKCTSTHPSICVLVSHAHAHMQKAAQLQAAAALQSAHPKGKSMGTLAAGGRASLATANGAPRGRQRALGNSEQHTAAGTLGARCAECSCPVRACTPTQRASSASTRTIARGSCLHTRIRMQTPTCLHTRTCSVCIQRLHLRQSRGALLRCRACLLQPLDHLRSTLIGVGVSGISDAGASAAPQPTAGKTLPTPGGHLQTQHLLEAAQASLCSRHLPVSSEGGTSG